MPEGAAGRPLTIARASSPYESEIGWQTKLAFRRVSGSPVSLLGSPLPGIRFGHQFTLFLTSRTIFLRTKACPIGRQMNLDNRHSLPRLSPENPGTTIVLPALSVAFAAFCIWLIVQIVNRRARWAKWTAVGLIAIPMLYGLSFGPACWISSRRRTVAAAEIVSRVYDPAICACGLCPKFVLEAAWWYSEVGAAEGWVWQFHHWHPIDGTESYLGPHE